MKIQYPCLELNITKLQENIEIVKGQCQEQGVEICAVVKGINALISACRVYEQVGVRFLASSRIEHMKSIKEADLKTPTACIRIPMISEVEDLVQWCDCSLESELIVLRRIDEAAGKIDKVHQVILMFDLGDLREGISNMKEMIETAKFVEAAEHLELLGTGVNLGCYGSIVTTVDKMDELVAKTETVESAIGRKLRYICGGSTQAMAHIWKHEMPQRVNLLRIGELILHARGMADYYGSWDLSYLHQDVFTLKAEVVEVKEKPSYPVGVLGRDAFGKIQTYVDRGLHRRAILAVGKTDYGSCDTLYIRRDDIKVLGASSDHTLIEVEDAREQVKVGDIIEFGIRYVSGLYLTGSSNVKMTTVE